MFVSRRRFLFTPILEVIQLGEVLEPLDSRSMRL